MITPCNGGASKNTCKGGDAVINMGQQAVTEQKVDVGDAFINAGAGKLVGDFVGGRVKSSSEASHEYNQMENQINRAERINEQNPRASRENNINAMKAEKEAFVSNRVVAASTSASSIASGLVGIVKDQSSPNGVSSNNAGSSTSNSSPTSNNKPMFPLPSPTQFVPAGRQGKTLVLQPNSTYQ